MAFWLTDQLTQDGLPALRFRVDKVGEEMVAADDKEDEDDEVGRGEQVGDGDGAPVGEQLGQHCTICFIFWKHPMH